jgi:hypothetical protein
LDLCPGEPPKFRISNACVQSQRKCQVYVGRTRFGCFGQHSFFLFRAVCLANIVSDLELELLHFLQSHPQQVSKVAQDAKQKANLFVHAFRRCALGEAVVLILNEGRLVHVNKHLVANQAFNVTDGVLREGSRLRKPQLVFLKELVCDLADDSDPIASNVGEMVEALLRFAATILFRCLGQSLRFGFA